MPKKSDDLLAALGKAMENADSPADAEEKPDQALSAGRLIKPAKAERSAGRTSKLTATIYPGDWHRLDEIKDFFRTHGYRNLSDSEAVRIACRAVRISDDLIPFFEEMKREDGRQRKTA